jgi:hypothetical protein
MRSQLLGKCHTVALAVVVVIARMVVRSLQQGYPFEARPTATACGKPHNLPRHCCCHLVMLYSLYTYDANT